MARPPSGRSPVPRQRARAELPPDDVLVERLLAGDEAMFVAVVEDWSPLMLRVARMYVSTHASAEEVVQDAWLALVRGLRDFEGRSSLHTWVLRIVANIARTRGVRESRSVPLSAVVEEDAGPTVAPDRFRGPDDEWPGHWTPVGAPSAWPASPEGSLLSREILHKVADGLERLPARQRAVVALRDVHGMTSEEVCEVLDISATNQRVLLHRGRARLRGELEDYYRGAASRVRT
ncbi:MAG: RNA polymerase sigma factor [Actinomycetota bacterium]